MDFVFDYEGNSIRVNFDEDGNLWFVAWNVSNAMGKSTSGNPTGSIAPEDMAIFWMNKGGQPFAMVNDPKIGAEYLALLYKELEHTLMVNESGLYTLIHEYEESKRVAFKKWLKDRVFPVFRKGCNRCLSLKHPSNASPSGA